MISLHILALITKQDANASTEVQSWNALAAPGRREVALGIIASHQQGVQVRQQQGHQILVSLMFLLATIY